ncbi:MAG: LacI family DNA-binding transcriptional regulator [Lentisphaeria bacterium]|nr:LacI family DNA-binding transcriptional regulator [Lentisphaeria bacterium]
MPRVTLKDIAQVCGVTPTLVSAVLNNRLGKITCVPEKKALILDTAEKMGYQPNIFARSMVKKHIPVAALMFHHREGEHLLNGSRYFSNRAATLTFALEEHQITPLLVFYRSEKEQISKLESLWNRGMIGGVISNIFPSEHLAFVERLHELKIPYVLMGRPKTEAVSVCTAGEYDIVRECHAHYGTKKAYLFQTINGQDVLFPWKDIPSYSRFDYKPLPATEEITADPDTLTAFLGTEYFLRTTLKCSHPFILEQESMAYLIPQGIPHALIRLDPNESAAKTAARLLGQWIDSGRSPKKVRHIPPPVPIVAKLF